MSIAPQLRQYLDEARVDYDIIDHRPTQSALDSARSANIPAERVAKAVLLDTSDDEHLLAVLPSDRKVELSELRSELGSKPRLSGEAEIGKLFRDCEVGAVPPVGYGVTTIIDDSLDQQPNQGCRSQGAYRRQTPADPQRSRGDQPTGDVEHGRKRSHHKRPDSCQRTMGEVDDLSGFENDYEAQSQ